MKDQTARVGEDATAPAWPVGPLDRVKAAEQRIADNRAPRRIPADVTDVDLVLAEVRYLLEGRPPPFWLDKLPRAVEASQTRADAYPESEFGGGGMKT